MGLFGSFFSSKVNVAALQKALAQKRFADARYLAGELAQQDLSAADKDVVAQLDAEAGDALAQLNLIEAVACQRNGDTVQANIHFELALEQVSSAELKSEVEQARYVDVTEVIAPAAETTATCNACSTSPLPSTSAEAALVNDDEIQFELILMSYPETIRTGYQQKGRIFKNAFLLAHEGRDGEALPLFEQVPVEEQDSSYWFELGALYARNGSSEVALSALNKSLQQNPEPSLSIQALVDLLLELERPAEALELIEDMLQQGKNAAFCAAQLAAIHACNQHWKAGAQQVRIALTGGYDPAGFIPLAASILEHDGALGEAEAVLKTLPAGGCQGGLPPLLAEFYLRHNRELEKVFASFNAAVRQEPDSPRWKLRLAQSCLARGWSEDGATLLHELISDPELSPLLQQEVYRSMERYNISQ